jgi:hypothetical protein
MVHEMNSTVSKTHKYAAKTELYKTYLPYKSRIYTYTYYHNIISLLDNFERMEIFIKLNYYEPIV